MNTGFDPFAEEGAEGTANQETTVAPEVEEDDGKVACPACD